MKTKIQQALEDLEVLRRNPFDEPTIETKFLGLDSKGAPMFEDMPLVRGEVVS